MVCAFSLVVAYSFPSRGIGKDGAIQWKIPEDMKRFASITTTRVVEDKLPIIVMGRKTWDSLPKKPLPNRFNIVLSNNTTKTENNTVFCKFDVLLEIIKQYNAADTPVDIKVIGGSEIYKLFLTSNLVIDKIYATEVYCKKEPAYDTTFPSHDLQLSEVSEFKKNQDDDTYFRFLTYTRQEKAWVNTEESNYLTLMREITSTSCVRNDRTGVGTFNLFGKQLTYDLTDTFPLCTTKRMFMRGIFEELMLYIRGQTDNSILTAKDIHVWDGNTSRSFLDKRGLSHYKEGDMGATYGFNFRHFGAEYKGCSESYEGCGFDQLGNVIHLIKTEPSSRRMVINLWDPSNNEKAALPACLCMYQFYVRNNTHLDLQIYIRSSDYFLANNWNTCTGALLVHLICSLNGVNLVPGMLSVCMGDIHVYSSHIKQVEENLQRQPFPFPKLIVENKKDSLEQFEFDDIRLIGYNAHKRIPAPMAV